MLRLPEVRVVEGAKVEVREDEGQEEERGRACEQVRGRVEVPAHELRRLAFDDFVARPRLRDVAHDEPPAPEVAGTADGLGLSP